MTLKELLIKHESKRNFPYKDSVGKWTIAVGRNLEDVGLSDNEIMFLLDNDIETAKIELCKYPFFLKLSQIRKSALIDMMFNLGAPRFSQFKNMIKAFENKDYDLAAKEMKDSKWANQVGKRADDLIFMILNDEWPE